MERWYHPLSSPSPTYSGPARVEEGRQLCRGAIRGYSDSFQTFVAHRVGLVEIFSQGLEKGRGRPGHVNWRQGPGEVDRKLWASILSTPRFQALSWVGWG